jgi:tetratricopeptide (TPR) repeat protein
VAASAPVPAAPVERALPLVSVVALSPDAAVKPAQAHLGALWAVLVEQSVLQTAAVNVVTHGPQAEILEDMGFKPGDPVDEATARKIAQLTGASDLVFGSFAPGEGGATSFTVRHFGVLSGKAKDLVTVNGTVGDAVAKVLESLAAELKVAPFTAVAVPPSDKAQKGLVRCVTFAHVAMERGGVKGRKVTLPKDLVPACKDAGSPLAQGAVLVSQALAGDAKAYPALQQHAAQNPGDRLAAMTVIRRAFETDDHDGAEAQLARVQALRPRDPDVLRMVGELEKDKDNWPSARVYFEKAVHQAPNSPYLRYLLSYASYRNEEPKEALDHAREALRLSGGEAPFYQLNLGERFLDAGALTEASLQLERAVKQMPERVTPRVRLGYVYVLAGEPDKALEHLQAAEKMKLSDREKERGVEGLLKLDLARAHALKGNAKESAKYLKQLEKAGLLEKSDLEAPEIAKLRDDPEMKKLKVR